MNKNYSILIALKILLSPKLLATNYNNSYLLTLLPM